jgi:hypothetical protein
MNGANGNAQNAPMTPEEQVLIMEVQRERARQQNDPIGKIIPPTEMTPGSPDNPAPQ